MTQRNLRSPQVQIENTAVSGWAVRAELDTTWATGSTYSLSVNADELCIVCAIGQYGDSDPRFVLPYCDDGCYAQIVATGKSMGASIPGYWRPQAIHILAAGELKFLNFGSGSGKLVGCILTPTLTGGSTSQCLTQEQMPANELSITGAAIAYELVEGANLVNDSLVSLPAHALIVAEGTDELTHIPAGSALSLDPGNTAAYTVLWGVRTSVGNPSQYREACVAKVTTAGLFNINQGAQQSPYFALKTRASSLLLSG